MTTAIEAEDPGSLAAVVARRARGLRAELGMTQAELGARLGISTPSMSERLRGAKDFDLDELPTLAQTLSTSVAYLLGLTDVRAPSIDVDEALHGVVRHQGLEPRTRWFEAASPLTLVPGGTLEPAWVDQPVATEEPLEQQATVLPFHRPAHARLLGGGRPRPRPTTEQAS